MSMRRLFLVVLAVLFSAMLPSPSSAADASVTLYVSPQGNDSWSGRLPAANAEKTDGPLAGVVRAAKVIETLKPNSPVKVLLRGGTYRIESPIVLGPENSGTKAAPITYAAYPGEKPIISGGRVISGWQKGDGPLWTTTIEAVKQGKWYFRELFVNGRRLTPARTPNDGWFRADSLVFDGKQKQPWKGGDAGKSRTALVFQGEDIRQWPDIDDAVAVVYHSWTTSRHHIKSIDVANHIVHFTAPSAWVMGYWDKNERYYIEGIREALDAPGEFYLDRKTGVLSYYPLPGEDMNAAEFVAPVAEELLLIAGDAAAGRCVEYLCFEGLSFQHSAWVMPKAATVDGQANAGLPHATIRAAGARNCLFERCEIAHTGSYGLWLQNGCKDNRIVQCHIHDLAAGGVRLGETTLPEQQELQAERNEIHNCFINDGGNVYHAGIGVWIGKSSHNKVHHCEISDFFYSGVSVGWSWGYQPSSANHNVIEYNHIHHLGYGELSDMGGIYHLGRAPGTQLRYNRIHDVLSYSYGGWGLYTDEGSSNVLMENNVVYRVKDGAFHQHYGRENIVRNNVLALSAQRGQIIRSREEEHSSFTIEGNIIFGAKTPPLGGNWGNGNYTLKRNLYWNTDAAALKFPGGLSLADWQSKGHDADSIAADPAFANPAAGDFSLKPGSPAEKIGFKPIDISTAGLVGDKEWTELPSKVKVPEIKMPGE